jgi:putative transposase
MFQSLRLFLLCLFTGCRSPDQLIIQNLALKQQLACFTAQRRKPKIRLWDRLTWIYLRWRVPEWRSMLHFVKAETVVRWHQKGFRLFWKFKSRCKSGRPSIKLKIQKLIREMALDNPTWGAPRIQAELEKMGITVALATVQKYMPQKLKPPSPQWKNFIQKKEKDICACDFFVVPTVTFRLLYVFVVMSHFRRKIVHFNVTEHPHASWTAQQIVDAFPYDTAPQYLIHDRDSIFGKHFRTRVEHMGIKRIMTPVRSPKANAICERVIGTLRRECTNHFVIFGRRHLYKCLKEYVQYYNDSRPHQSLNKDSPNGREAEPPENGKVIKLPILGGLHHRYTRKAA